MKRALVIAVLFTAAIFTSSAVQAASYEEGAGSGGAQAVEGAMIGAVIGTLLGAMIVNNTRQEPVVVHHYQPAPVNYYYQPVPVIYHNQWPHHQRPHHQRPHHDGNGHR